MLKLKICAKVMLTNNIDVQDRLINGQTRIIRHIEFVEGSARKVYLKFYDEQARPIAMKSSYLGRQNSCAPNGKCETEVSINQERLSIVIHQAYSLSFNISMNIYCS